MPTTTDAATRVTLPCPTCGRWNRIDASRAAAGPKCGACSAPIALDHPVSLDDDSFDRVISGSGLPVLVDFYADWCAPCRMMAPAIAQLARERVGTLLVAKLDTERARQTGERFQIRGLPTVVLFRGGREAKRQTGAGPIEYLRTFAQ